MPERSKKPNGVPIKKDKAPLGPLNESVHFKKSFDPISNVDTSTLILGSMPGDKSIALNEYYGFKQNRLWRIIAALTQQDLPLTYEEKKALLLKNKIGLWDVVHQAERIGSLDTAIKSEIPNDLHSFISSHKQLKVIAFNGLKAGALYDKYFDRKEHIRYVSLPSSSPANAAINFESICLKWSTIFDESQ